MAKRKESDTQAMERIRRRRRGKTVRRIALAAIALAAVLIYATGVFGTSIALVSDWFDTAALVADRGEGYPVSLPLQGYLSGDGVSGAAALLTKDNVYVLSPSGRVALSLSHRYTNPVLVTSSTRVCLYSRFGHDLTVASRSRQLYTQRFENPILTAAMGGGALAVATKESESFTAAVTVYDHSFKAVYTWHSAQLYPARLALSTGGRYLAAACPKVENGYLGTALYFLDTKKSEETACVTMASTSVLAMQVLPGQKLLAVCDTAAVTFDMTTGAETGRYDYGGKSLVAWNCEKGRRIALCFGNPDRGEGESVLVTDETLVPLTEIALSGPVDGLVCTGTALWRLSGAQVERYSLKDGTLTESYALSARARALVWAGGPVAVELAALEKPA